MTTLNKLAERDVRAAAGASLEPAPRDELLYLAGLLWSLAGLLFLAWVWGWV